MQISARENLERTIRHQNSQWLPLRYDGTLQLLRSDVLRVRPVEGGLDDWGVRWLYTNEEEGSYPDGKAVLDVEAIDDFQVPDTDFQAVTENMRQKVERLREQDVLPIAYNELVVFERAQLLLGYEDFMIATIAYRDEFDRLIEKIFQYNLRLTQALMDAGVAGIRFTDDWGMQDRLFISPKDWRCFFKERYRVLYQSVKARGGYVFHHSCGCVMPILEDISEIGVDVLDPIQPACNDIFAMKRQYGDRLAFMGGLDTQTWLTFGTPEEVYRKTLEVCHVMGKNGGYIAAPSHSITIPQANREAMYQAVDAYNKGVKV